MLVNGPRIPRMAQEPQPRAAYEYMETREGVAAKAARQRKKNLRISLVGRRATRSYSVLVAHTRSTANVLRLRVPVLVHSMGPGLTNHARGGVEMP